MKKFLCPMLLVAMFPTAHMFSAINESEFCNNQAFIPISNGAMPSEFPGDSPDICFDDNGGTAVDPFQPKTKSLCFCASKFFIAEEDWLGIEHCDQIECLDFSKCQINAARFQVLLERCGKKFKSISFSQCTGINNDLVSCISKQCSNLEQINLCGCNNIATYALKDLVKSCQHLKHIGLPRVDNDLLCAMAEREQKFESINLSGCSGFYEDTLINLLEVCGPQLRLLDISNCSVISGKSLYGPLTDRTLDVLLARCQNLESLDISCWDGSTEAKLIKYLSICGPKLRSLSLFNCRCVTNNVLDVIAQCCRNLVKLDLGRCSPLLYERIGVLHARLPHATIIRPDLVAIPGN